MTNYFMILFYICCTLIDNIFSSATAETKNTIINSHKEILNCIINRNELAGYAAINHHYDLVDKEILKWKAVL